MGDEKEKTLPYPSHKWEGFRKEDPLPDSPIFDGGGEKNPSWARGF